MVSFVINWISVADTRYCQVINILLFNSKSINSITFKGNVTAFILFDLAFNNSYKYNSKHWKRTLSRKEKDNLKSGFVKGCCKCNFIHSIPFKAFSLSKYFNMYIKVYIIKWAPFVFIQGLKKKYISGLSVAEKKNKFTTFLISNLKYKSLLAYITPHCNSRFGTISFSLSDIHC